MWAAPNWQRYTLFTPLVEGCWAAVRRHLWEVHYVPHWALEERLDDRFYFPTS